MDCQIHPFLIQPIVENAVRHGKDGEGKAYVALSIRQESPGVLYVRIADYGVANFDPDLLARASGTGIRNVRRRLDNLYGGDLEFSKNQPHGLAVAMRIFTHEGEAR
jgi:LytS/YehU family sensor histidine kinase